MKILYVIESGDPGGAENVLLSLAEYFKMKYSVGVGCFREGWVYNELKFRKFNPQLIHTKKGSFDVSLLSNLLRLIKKENIGLIHSHLFDTNFYSCIAAKMMNIPHIATEHGDIHLATRKMNIKRFIKAKVMSIFSDKIIFVSKFTRDKFLRIAKVPKKKAIVVYNGIDLNKYEDQIDIQKKRAEIGINQDEFVIGNVGSLYPVKGQTYLLKAARNVISEIPSAKFLFIGKGGLKNILKEEAEHLGIENSVKFLGFREDIKELLKVMNVFVLSSLSEGLPLSLIEAMASKVPVVATNVGGIPEVVDDGMNGFLIPPAEPEAMAIKIKSLLKDSFLADTVAQQGYEKIRQFDIQSMLNKYEEIYSELARR